MTVKVVTDSTSDLPSHLANSLGITVVPLNVHFGSEVFKDGVDMTADTFYERLTSEAVLPKTSQPSVGEFLEVYESLAQESDGIVSIHISSQLSGTYNSAIQASREPSVASHVEVVDTRHASMALGITAMAAARAARDGLDTDEVARVAREVNGRAECFAMLDTVEYLAKGGRIGKAKALMGSLLRVRPMIRLDGVVHELGKERSRQRGIARLKQIVRDMAPIDEVSVMHSTTPDEASAVADELSDLLADDKKPIVARMGPVVGTYAGPGVLGMGVLRSSGS